LKKHRKFSYFLSLILLLFLIAPEISRAWGTIQGVVQNNVGDPIPGALVETQYVSMSTWMDGSLPGVLLLLQEKQ